MVFIKYIIYNIKLIFCLKFVKYKFSLEGKSKIIKYNRKIDYRVNSTAILCNGFYIKIIMINDFIHYYR